MIIVHVLNSLTIGGIEKVVVDICNNIDLKKNQVFIITLSDKYLTLKPKLNEGIKVISLPFKNDTGASLILFWLFGLPKLIKNINKIKPDVVHSHIYYHYLLFLSFSLKFSGIKPTLFRTVHTSGLFYSSKSIVNRFRCQIEKTALKIYPTYLVSISKTIYRNNQLLMAW